MNKANNELFNIDINNDKKDTKNFTQEYETKKIVKKKNFYINGLPLTTIKRFKSLASKKGLSHTKLITYLLDFYERNN